VVGREVQYTLLRVAEQEVAIHADPVALSQKPHEPCLQSAATRLAERDQLECALHGLERIGLRVRLQFAGEPEEQLLRSTAARNHTYANLHESHVELGVGLHQVTVQGELAAA